MRVLRGGCSARVLVNAPASDMCWRVARSHVVHAPQVGVHHVSSLCVSARRAVARRHLDVHDIAVLAQLDRAVQHAFINSGLFLIQVRNA